MPSTASTLPRPGTQSTGQTGEEFTLNFEVIEAAYPLAKLSCDTDDGCGQTCSTSACNSQANNPS
ncbi:FxLD family lanthipeptide [Saccharopolyspora cebuensis]|uniref:FxLD family lanthipeptide n=1 Tax=Saccharopolyspora cebuensis TaxID=418759 RepID=UPI0031F0613C